MQYVHIHSFLVIFHINMVESASAQFVVFLKITLPELAIKPRPPPPIAKPSGLIDGFPHPLAPGLIHGDKNVNLRVL